MTHVILRSCCNDATCVPACPVNCIHPTPDEPGYGTTEMLYIDPDGCVDCGACVDVCPVEAIAADYDLTELNERYLDINALYFANPAVQGYSSTPAQAHRPTWAGENAPLRVAIVGSGPSACYAAETLLAVRGLDVEVHVYERLPVPWGLVRFGVAPDHAPTKAVTASFMRTAGRANFFFHLNVEVGLDLTHEDLMAHHHAVVYAVGARSDRRLDVPGEDLPGSRAATDFVAWYNGHPDAAGASFDLSAERAVVVGNGNVALDVARILVSDPASLARTDMAAHAVAALRESKVREVVVLGRRGPAQAAYSNPELLELGHLPGVDVVVEPDGFEVDDATEAALKAEPWSAAARKVGHAREYAANAPSGAGRRIVLRYSASPVEVLGTERVQGLRIARNELVPGPDGTLRARQTDRTEDLDCGLVLRSVGYRSTPLPGLPFDDATGTIPNAAGRVVAGQDPLVGVYVTGWAKRGPSGVIGTNRRCAEETVQTLLADHAAGNLNPPIGTTEALTELILERAPHALDYRDWRAIDAHERALGKEHGRPRTKLVDVAEMLAVARGVAVS
ncbi:MAG: FAD-dependent oxidoreductase [Sporichthyaceae bacterium]